MLDRFQAPLIQEVQEVTLPNIEHLENRNGVKVHYHYTPNTETFKLELYTNGSQFNAVNSAECQLSLKLLKEGTNTKSSKEYSIAIDSIGSFLEISPGFDQSSITIFGLSKYFKENVQLLTELIHEPAFKETSLERLKSKEIDRLKQNLEKGSYLSSINLRNALFGLNHPYGHVLSEVDINDLTQKQVSSFHKKHISSFEIYLSGDIDKNYLSHLDSFIGNQKKKINYTSESIPKIKDSVIRSEKFVQSSIKLGKRLFTRSHKDYFKFIVTNEILGGYFGSRLMKNIREEKGLTYGIFSHLYSLKHDGYFLISSDIKGENESLALEEIKKEIISLQNIEVSKEELQTVKNYMIGTFVNSLSNPFGIIEKHKILLSQELAPDFYDHYISAIKEVKAIEIMEMASLYLHSDSLTISIVGN